MNGMEGMEGMDDVDPMVALQINQSHWGQSFDLESLNPSQMLPPSSYMNTNYQIQWPQSQDPGWGSSLNGPSLGMAPQVAFNGGAGDDGTSIACSSHCDAACASQCGDSVQANCCFDPSCQSLDMNHTACISQWESSVNANCCFDPSCQGLDVNHAACMSQWEGSVNPANCCYDPSCQGLDMNHTGCYFDESCHVPAPCRDENCQEVIHRCDDEDCMVPTVSTTPASAPVLTPTESESDAMTNPLTSPVEPSIEMDTSPDWSAAEPGMNGESLPLPLMSNEDQFTCRWVASDGGVCLARFENYKELQGHCKENHLKNLQKVDAGFRCSWYGCARATAFSQKSKLERHMQTHTGFKPVECEICGLLLSAKQSLEQHRRTHSGEKPWKCPHKGCTKSFKQQSALTMHKRTHTGEKPLKCEICHKRFGESSNLSKHRRTHNLKGDHVCERCGKDFNRLDQLRRHLDTCGRKRASARKDSSTESSSSIAA